MTTKILIVDDDPVSLRFAAAVYHHHGCATLSAKSGPVALDMAGKNHPDLVILDMQIGQTDGLQLLAEILLCDELYKPAFIALSGETRSSRHAIYLNSGCSRVLVKPCSAAQLLECLELVCSAPQKTTQNCLSQAYRDRYELEQISALNALDGDQSLLASLREMYTNELKSLCPQIDDHLLMAQFGAAARLVHRLNAAAGYCGAPAFRRCCVSLESALKTGNTEAIAQHYADFLLQARSLISRLAETHQPYSP